tara:strand:+ start:1545 stop:2045 length:501 start_codon:yes stop_codon:yes gene_type:complete
MEQWKYVPGTEKMYKVSNRGKVVSLQKGKTIELKGTFNKGALVVGLVINGKNKSKAIRRIVLGAFLNISMKGERVEHINGDVYDCSFKNLRLGTEDKPVSGGKGSQKGMSILKEDDIPVIFDMFKRKEKVKEIQEKFNISRSTVYKIKQGKLWGWMNLHDKQKTSS